MNIKQGIWTDLPKDILVYYESCHDVNAAIEREKQLKKWRREKKNELVNATNPEWRELKV